MIFKAVWVYCFFLEYNPSFGMTEPHKQKKYLSSDHLYFLPILNKLTLNSFRSTSKVQLSSPSKPKPIEQIIKDKDSIDSKRNISCSFSRPQKSTSSKNLYNKYEFLPQIYAKRYKKNQVKNGCLSQQLENMEKNSTRFEFKAAEDQLDKNKENSCLEFNSEFYRGRFNQRLRKEVKNIEFKLNTTLSHNNLILADTIEEEPIGEARENEAKPKKYKYTKLQIDSQDQETQKQLQRVPNFLLKLLQPSKEFFTQP